MKSVVRAISRLERRKLLKKIASIKVCNAAESWWKNALLEFDRSLYGTNNSYSSSILTTTTTLSDTNILISDTTTNLSSKDNTINNINSNNSSIISSYPSQLPGLQVISYFDRMYSPTQLVEFDTILGLDYMSPADGIVIVVLIVVVI